MKHVLRMGKVEKWPMPQLNDVKIVAFEKIGKKVGSINHLCKGKREITLTFSAGNKLDPLDSSKALKGDLQFYIKDNKEEERGIKCFQKILKEVQDNKDYWMQVYAPRRMSMSASGGNSVSSSRQPSITGTPREPADGSEGLPSVKEESPTQSRLMTSKDNQQRGPKHMSKKQLKAEAEARRAGSFDETAPSKDIESKK